MKVNIIKSEPCLLERNLRKNEQKEKMEQNQKCLNGMNGLNK